MVWYKTKKEILERMGRKWKSIRSLDRAIKNGEVVERNGEYAYRLDLLSELCNQRKAEIDRLSKEWNKEELEEAKAQWEYWENECKRYGRLINAVISVVYRRIKPMVGSRLNQSEEEFKESIIEEVKRLEN